MECPLSALRSLLIDASPIPRVFKKRVQIKFDKDRGSRSFAAKQLGFDMSAVGQRDKEQDLGNYKKKVGNDGRGREASGMERERRGRRLGKSVTMES